MIARASRIRPVRTLWITERSATIAPTPIATQTKKNSSRRQLRTQLAREHLAGRTSRGRLRRRPRRRAHDAPVAQRDDHVGDRRQLLDRA